MTEQEFRKECDQRNLRIVNYWDRLFGFRVVHIKDREQLHLAATFLPTRSPPEDFGENKK